MKIIAATEGTVTVSSVLYKDRDSSKMFDGNPNTFWHSKADDMLPTVEIKLEQKIIITGVVMTMRKGGRDRYKSVCLRIDGHIDHSNCTASDADYSNKPDQNIIFTMSPKLAEKIEIVWTLAVPDSNDNSNGGNLGQIAQLEFITCS